MAARARRRGWQRRQPDRSSGGAARRSRQWRRRRRRRTHRGRCVPSSCSARPRPTDASGHGWSAACSSPCSVWATWFFATGHAVKIDVDPADSAVRLHGGLVLPVGGNHFARPGEYTVEIRREGYEPCARRSRSTDAPNQSFRYRLAKLPGILRVQTPVAARISVAGKDVGSAPGEVRLPAGRHELLVTAPTVPAVQGDRRHQGHGTAPVAGGETRCRVGTGHGADRTGGRHGDRGRRRARRHAGASSNSTRARIASSCARPDSSTG